MPSASTQCQHGEVCCIHGRDLELPLPHGAPRLRGRAWARRQRTSSELSLGTETLGAQSFWKRR